MPYLMWEERWLPKQCSADSISVLHSPFNFGLPWASSCPTVLTLHDAMFQPGLNGFSFRRRLWESRLYHWIARSRASRIITVTEFAKKDLVNVLGIAPDRISVTHEGADPVFSVRPSETAIQAVRTKYGLDNPYFFYVGGWEQHKTCHFSSMRFGMPQFPASIWLLAAGSARDGFVCIVCARGCTNLGWLFDDDLVPLYAGALAFVHPARHESFGLQLCEAMELGCPVLAARAGAFPEVLAHGGETFSLDQSDELVGLLRRLAADASFREDLVRRATERSRDLSWSRTAEQTISVYKQVMAV